MSQKVTNTNNLFYLLVVWKSISILHTEYIPYTLNGGPEIEMSLIEICLCPYLWLINMIIQDK